MFDTVSWVVFRLPNSIGQIYQATISGSRAARPMCYVLTVLIDQGSVA